MTLTGALLWGPLIGQACVLPDLGRSLGFWRSCGHPCNCSNGSLCLSVLVSVQDEMLVASGAQGECVTRKDSVPLRTTWEAQESVCSLCPSGEGNGNPLQYSYLENSTVRGAWQATVHGVSKSDTTEQLIQHFVPQGLRYTWAGLLPTSPTLRGPAHAPSLVESGISFGWWQARSYV